MPTQNGPQSSSPRCHGPLEHHDRVERATQDERSCTIASAPKYLPRMTSLSFTGIVMSSSIVPTRFSSASERIVKSGRSARQSAGGIDVEHARMVARSTCQKPPL